MFASASLLKKEETKVTTKLKRIAHQKFLTKKPGTRALVRRIRKPLITKINNPKVKILMGRVKRIRIGLRKVLITPKTMATIKAVKTVSILTPGRI